eukprot:263490-Chlamydomonas_euryale.AAC.1
MPGTKWRDARNEVEGWQRVPCVGLIRDMCGVHTRFRVSPPRAERPSSARRGAPLGAGLRA